MVTLHNVSPATRTRIKVCGFTRRSDIEAALALGADALGFVFYPKSKRCLTMGQAADLVAGLPAFVTTVALFVEPDHEVVNEVIDAMRPDLLQFHGEESPEYCQSFRWPYLKAFRVGGPGMETATALEQTCLKYGDARGWLYDSFTPAYGGSGHGYDRSMLEPILANPLSRPVILSGGLRPENAEDLVRRIRPWAVDVSSGVEDAPGEKSIEKMQAFIAAVRRGDGMSGS